MRKLIFFILFIPVSYLTGDSLDLTLDDAIEIALEANETVLSAKEKVTEKRAGIGIARSNFLPTVDLQGTYTRLGKIQSFEMEIPQYAMLPLQVYDAQTGDTIGYTDSVPMVVGADTMALEMGKRDNYILRTTVKQTLFTGGKVLNGYKIAKLSYEIEEQNYKKTTNDIRFKVTEIFYKTLAVQEAVNLIKESYSQMERHVGQVETLYKNGYVSKLDLLRVKVGLSNLRTQMIRTENGCELAKDGLKMLLSLDLEDEIILEEQLRYETYEIMLEEATETALEQRPEIRGLNKTVEITNRALSIEKAGFAPNVFAALNYDYKKPVGFSDNNWGTDWNVTVGFAMPIFTGFSRVRKIGERQAQAKQVKYGLEQLEEGIRLEVKSAYLNLKQEEEILKYQDENIKQAEEALAIAEERYKSGLVTNLEVMDTQLALTKAKTNQLQALSNYLIAKASLEKAIGR